MEDKIRNFKDLRVWQKGIELVREVYNITNNFPKEEQYCLISQMRRAAISIPANIAEGFRRRSAKEQKRFLSVALGSCAELESHLAIARELGYTDEYGEEVMSVMLNHICGMLVNLDKKI